MATTLVQVEITEDDEILLMMTNTTIVPWDDDEETLVPCLRLTVMGAEYAIALLRGAIDKIEKE